MIWIVVWGMVVISVGFGIANQYGKLRNSTRSVFECGFEDRFDSSSSLNETFAGAPATTTREVR